MQSAFLYMLGYNEELLKAAGGKEREERELYWERLRDNYQRVGMNHSWGLEGIWGNVKRLKTSRRIRTIFN